MTKSKYDESTKDIFSVENPNETFAEDPSAILDIMRKYAQSDTESVICPETWIAMNQSTRFLKDIPPDIVRDMLNDIVTGPNAYKACLFCKNILCSLIPELSSTIGFDQKNPYHHLDVFMHIMETLKYLVTPIREDVSKQQYRLHIAALFHDIGKPACALKKWDPNTGDFKKMSFPGHPLKSKEISILILERFNYSEEDKEWILLLIENHDHEFKDDIKSIQKFIKKLPPKIDVPTFMKDLIQLKKADASAHVDNHSVGITGERIEELYEEISKNRV